MYIDPAIRDHQAWLGYLQPDGLVVSAAALVDLQVILPKGASALQEDFLCLVGDAETDDGETVPVIGDFKDFVTNFLEWPDECLAGLDPAQPLPEALCVPLPEFGETLMPSFAFLDPKAKDPDNPWVLLVHTVPPGADLDTPAPPRARAWSASPARRFERILRETNVSIGLLSNGAYVRLIYAPKGESSGSLTFPVSAMMETAGRPILAAFHLLLCRYRLLAAPSEARLPALLTKSREYQNTVSTALAEQVLEALYELIRGFQAADEQARGELLLDVLARRPDDVYNGLLTVLMRLVFLLYAEDRNLMPVSALYVQHYSAHGLFEKLRRDAEHYPDIMEHRYGAWAQLLVLFRAVFNGCRHLQMQMPARKGHLFDPDRFPFLEGRTRAEHRLPLVSDGVVTRVLEKLLILKGERLSYRTLDVEQIGSVYETMMGFRLEVTGGPTIAIKAGKKHGAPTPVNLETLLGIKGKERGKWLSEKTDQKLSGDAAKGLESAASFNEILAALERRIARSATPDILPKGAMVLQPSDERRRSGSHYTPRSLTEPIVRTALKPVLDRLGGKPTPETILDLKICDVAVGSGAFLVETCRQLGDVLVEAWHVHGRMPTIPGDEDEVLLARRLVAQRCLYGVDKNPVAADLAKLSLWLVTLAKDHPFTFLDHAIRSGDSLVGLTRNQIAGFHWDESFQLAFGQGEIEERLRLVSKYRREILEGGDFVSPELKRQKLDLADEALRTVRQAGDLVIAAFFNGAKDKERRALRKEHLKLYTDGFKQIELLLEVNKIVEGLRCGKRPIAPFHWEIEFPEVFDRENPGFDVIVGNPPFMGGRKISTTNGAAYLAWILACHQESDGNADIVAHFYRLAFKLLRSEGCFGLIATNTIGQGDTRSTGLERICTDGGTIYAARKRYKWPGQAAVVVSVVWVRRGYDTSIFNLDGRQVPFISAYLFHAGGHKRPTLLKANEGKSFQGSTILGMGFTFDDDDRKGLSSPVAEIQRLVANDPKNSERIFPYIGGEELNDSPTHAHRRLIINFEEFPLRREYFEGKAWAIASEKEQLMWLRNGVVPNDYPGEVAADWPDLLSIVETKVKPERAQKSAEVRSFPWWRYWRLRGELGKASHGLARLIALSRVGQHAAFTFVRNGAVVADSMVLIATENHATFCVLQSRIHEFWARFFASSMKDDLRYTPSDCFETFPFPRDFETKAALEHVGQEYYEFRANLMVRNNEGLTKTYNRFHNPDETSPDILRLRELHADMDRVVLDAYGWTDIPTDCEFILDYEDDDDDDENDSGRRRKKPWRYRWPDPVRDEILARLLALNAERAEEERLAGLTAGGKFHPTGKRGKGKRKDAP